MNRIRNLTTYVLGGFILLLLAACAASGTSRSTGTYIDDKTISAKVKTGLATNEDTSALDVDVETYRGVVQLSGFVDSEKSKEAAEKVASGVPGVKGVENNLIVRSKKSQ